MKCKKLFIFTLLISMFCVRVYAEDDLYDDINPYIKDVNEYQVIIEDDANLLTDSQKESLMDDMEKIAQYGNVVFKTINTNDGTAASYAKSYYHNKFGKGSSGTIFLIDMDNRYIYIFSDGNVYKIITTAKAEIITDNTYKYASKSDYYGCAKEAFSEIYTLLEGGKISEPMKYISNTILSLVLASLFSFIIVLNKSKLKKSTEKEEMKDVKKKVAIVSPIVAEFTGYKTVYSPSSSSSGGGGGGGGGGSSGGGGGHSF